MDFKRFKTLAEMQAWAATYAAEQSCKVYAETGIYTDNNGLTYRPAVNLFTADAPAMFAVSLRWYAFADEPDLDHFKKVEAMHAADRYVDQVQSKLA